MYGAKVRAFLACMSVIINLCIAMRIPQQGEFEWIGDPNRELHHRFLHAGEYEQLGGHVLLASFPRPVWQHPDAVPAGGRHRERLLCRASCLVSTCGSAARWS
eukprot:762484-Hanusia_phi.AAC.2